MYHSTTSTPSDRLVHSSMLPSTISFAAQIPAASPRPGHPCLGRWETVECSNLGSRATHHLWPSPPTPPLLLRLTISFLRLPRPTAVRPSDWAARPGLARISRSASPHQLITDKVLLTMCPPRRRQLVGAIVVPKRSERDMSPGGCCSALVLLEGMVNHAIEP
jgi:hypothetical protein